MAVADVQKEKVMIQLDPDLYEKLRLERAKTRKTYAEIIEPLLRSHYERQSAAATA